MSDRQTALAPQGSYLTPSFEHARVSDAMRHGVITCHPDATMQDVARMMATNHVHAIVVTGIGDGPAWGVVTAADVVATAAEAPDRLAGSCAGGELVTVGPDDPLEDAAKTMLEHETNHVLVVDPRTKTPVGVVSALDIAGIVAWGRG